MGKCFVIQPFDKGKFDKRYADVFAPAISEAGLEPYRIDRDPTVTIPIEDIQAGIESSKLAWLKSQLTTQTFGLNSATQSRANVKSS